MGISFTPLYLWREFLLAVMGAAHFMLLWARQDVRIPYAAMGAMLLVFQRGTPRMQALRHGPRQILRLANYARSQYASSPSSLTRIRSLWEESGIRAIHPRCGPLTC